MIEIIHLICCLVWFNAAHNLIQQKKLYWAACGAENVIYLLTNIWIIG